MIILLRPTMLLLISFCSYTNFWGKKEFKKFHQLKISLTEILSPFNVDIMSHTFVYYWPLYFYSQKFLFWSTCFAYTYLLFQTVFHFMLVKYTLICIIVSSQNLFQRLQVSLGFYFLLILTFLENAIICIYSVASNM